MQIDFRLASTYVPVFVSVMKLSLLVVICFFIMPNGHMVLLLGLLQLDRIYTNNEFIIDVNYTLTSWLIFQYACIERRSFGINTAGIHILVLAWIACALVPFKHNTSVCVLLFMGTCVTRFDPENFVWYVCRSYIFLAYVLSKTYVQRYLNQEQSKLHVAVEAGVIVCGHVIVAAAFFLIATSLLVFRCVRTEQEQIDLEAQALRQALAFRKCENAKD